MYNAERIVSQNSPSNRSKSQIKYSLLPQQRVEMQNIIMNLKQQIAKLTYMSEENENLKDQLQRKDIEIKALEQNINELKEQLQRNHAQSMKIYQDSEKNKRQIQKLSIDNQTMEMLIENLKSQRKLYTNKLQEMKKMKDQLADKLLQRQKVTQQTLIAKRDCQRQLCQYKLTLQQFSEQLNHKDQTIKTLQLQIKSSLESQLESKNLALKYKAQLNQWTTHAKHFKQQKEQMQRERDDIYQKLQQYQSSRGERSNVSLNTTTQTTLLQIQSFMNQINILLDRKKIQSEKSTKINRDMKVSLQCLEKLLR